MTSSSLLSITTFMYFGTALGYLVALVFRSRGTAKYSGYLAWITTVVQTAAIVIRWVESYQLGIGHAPMTNMYESLIFFAWCIVLAYLLLELKYDHPGLGAAVVPFAFLAMAYASFGQDTGIKPLIPALKSNWLIAHVVTCFLGYAAFALACGTGLIYLFFGKEDSRTRMLPGKDVLEEVIYQTVLVGFLLLTAGIATGAVWADQAWGTYWSWDPQGNLVADHLVRLRGHDPRPAHARLAGQARRLDVPDRIRGGAVHLLRGEPAPGRTSLLRLNQGGPWGSPDSWPI